MADVCIRLLSELIPASGDATLPTEFRIFRAGRNDSTKGPVWFDERSAELVMAAANAHGVDDIIDLEHRSVKPRLVDADTSDTDARGYYRPAVRAGELWATGVNWTDDGAERLRTRRQRYISPAFRVEQDPELDGGKGGERVVELINVALCSMPASYQIDPLVRNTLDTSRRPEYAQVVTVKTRTNADREAMARAQSALASGDASQANQILTEALAVGQPDADGDDDEDKGPPSSAGAAPSHIAMDQTYAMQLLSMVPGAADVGAALSALLPKCLSVTGAKTLPDALARVQKLFSDVAAAEATERRSLITALVELGSETPATAWSNNAPVERLASEDLGGLRGRVAALRAAKTAEGTKVPTPPEANTVLGEAVDGLDISTLSEFDRNFVKGIADVAARKRTIESLLRRNARATGATKK